jgi:hypothetical protein
MKFVIHLKNISNILDFGAGSVSHHFFHIYMGFSAQPTYSSLGSRKQTLQEASTAQVSHTFSCFSNFNKSILSKLLVGGVKKYGKKGERNPSFFRGESS